MKYFRMPQALRIIKIENAEIGLYYNDSTVSDLRENQEINFL